MSIHPLAGKPAPQDMLADIGALRDAYSARKPDVADKAQRVSFGTSGHRGSSLRTTFNEDHVLAITQAICEYRSSRGIDGPLFIGKDTHALSEPAFVTALEVLAANGVDGHGRPRRRLHPHAGDLARHPRLQPRPHHRAGRRHRHHALAQSAGRRRLQVQPAARRPGRHRHHALDRRPRQRAAGRRPQGREAHGLRRRAQGGARLRLRRHLRRRPRRGARHGRDPRRRAQDRRRSAGRRRRGLLGADRRALRHRTSRSSTQRSIRPSAS